MRSPGMRPITTLLCAGILAALAGCHPQSPAPDPATTPRASTVASLTVAGVQRGYRLYVPPDLSLTSPIALVVMLHGGFGSAAQAEQAYGWNARADDGGFAVVYPDGLGRAWAVGGGCCGQPGRDGVDDVGFIVAVVDDVRTRLPVDPDRIFATGMSNGGMMSYRLACDSTIFAAIAPVAATMLGDCPAPRAVSLLHVHGLADERVRFDGGPGNGVGHIDGPDVPSLVDSWRTVGQCAAATTVVAGRVATTEAQCAQGRAVVLVTVAGAGHQWPGAGERTAVQTALGMDPPSDALNATDTIWRFFSAHPGR